VSRAPDGTLLANMIEGSGPNFDDTSTMRGRSSGPKKRHKATAQQPDVVMKLYRTAQGVAGVVLRGSCADDTSRQNFVPLQQEYARAATTSNPDGRYADQTTRITWIALPLRSG